MKCAICHHNRPCKPCFGCHRLVCHHCGSDVSNAPDEYWCDDCEREQDELDGYEEYTYEDLLADERAGSMADMEAADELYAFL